MLQEILDFIGRAICHQIDERSLHISGRSLSVCARDTGIYIGIFSSLIYLHFVKRNREVTIPTLKMSFFLLLFMVPLVVDGVGSYAHLFESTNIRRLITGSYFGFALPYFLYPLICGNSLKLTSRPVIKGRKDIIYPMLLAWILGLSIYFGYIPFLVLNIFIILMIIVWFSLCVSFLFLKFHNNYIKWTLSFIGGIIFLSLLSWAHFLFLPS